MYNETLTSLHRAFVIMSFNTQIP